MSYCSTTELANLTGSTLSSTILQEIIDEGDREIDSRLEPYGLSGSSSEPSIKGASLNFAIAGLLTRYRLDGTKPGSVRALEFAESDDIDAAIAGATAKAEKLVGLYITANYTGGTFVRLRKVNG